ncbi:MAG: large conductance mechanosensitive channel protein MscL [Planctomycetota bacterium]
MPMHIVQEFKSFILKGNAVDLAVGIVIGAAFTKVVTTLVDKVIMPPTAFLLGGVDLSSKKIPLFPAVAKGQTHPVYQNTVEKDIPAVDLEWGALLQAMFELVVIGAAIFVAIKAINALRFKEEDEPPKKETTPADIRLLTEIRDLLQK